MGESGHAMKSPREWYRKLKLSDQLVLWFLLLALTPLLLITLLTYRHSVNLLQTEVTRSLLAIARRQARQIEHYGEERQNDMTTLAHAPAVAEIFANSGGGEAGEDQALRTFLQSYSEIGSYDDFFLVSREGEVIFADRRLEMVGSNARDQIYRGSEFQKAFERALTLLSTEFSDFEHFPETGDTAAYIAAPVFYEGQLVGVIVLRLEARDIYEIVNDYTGLGETGETMVARNWNNQVLFVAPLRHAPDAAFRRTVALGEPVAMPAQKAITGERGAGISVDYRGAEVLAAWSYLPLFRWGIVVKIDREEAFEPVHVLRDLSILIALATAIVVVLVGTRVARSVSRPVEELTRATELMRRGALGQHIDVRSENEIGALAKSFNEMAARLRSIVENLDGLVAERTQELNEKNEDLEVTLTQLKEAQNQLVLQEKMASLGGLTAGIAHEIKNPLNFINNFADLSVDLVEETREEIDKLASEVEAETADLIKDNLGDLQMNVAKIAEHGKRADSIVRGMLLHSRGAPGERRPTDINALLDEYVNLAYHGMRAKDASFNVTIEKDYDSSIGEVQVVPQDISRVFLNIVNNGCYSAHEKKKEAGASYSPVLRVQTRNLGDACEIRIRDNGKGIPPDVMQKLFNPFFTTKPPGEGTGLGLSMSYEIVVSGHEGEMRAETEPGEFAEFVIKLPTKA